MMYCLVVLSPFAYLLPGASPRTIASKPTTWFKTHSSVAPVCARTRCRPVVAYDGGINEEVLETMRCTNGTSIMEWTTTESRLLYRDTVTPSRDAVIPMNNQIVAVHFTASLLNGQVVAGTGDRPLALRLGESSKSMFQEALMGMRVGGRRRVKITPDCRYSYLGDQTVLIELELLGIQTGVDALIFNLLNNRLAIIQVAILLSFAPDALNFFGVLPAPSLGASFEAPGFGAVDILSSAAASAPPAHVADPANQWAVQGLQGLF
mmetsp:Transcript_28864/g.47849  ORF Transcript_28864/g.47849 Transcript_28864/m.47849 type:complete len:264 (-) Transcript_28864:150-941(-)